MGPFEMVVAIVFLSMATGTIHKYMDYRARMADRQVRGADRSVMQAIEALRAEISALKQHETEAVLSFDSTLQTLEARVKHLERQSLAAGVAGNAPLSAAAPAAEEPVRLGRG